MIGEYLWIALGSALGGMARYFCSGIAARTIGETFPWGTLMVNVAWARSSSAFSPPSAAPTAACSSPPPRGNS